VLGWDWAMAALTGFDDLQAVLRTMDPARHRAVGWSILGSLALAQLRSGRSVILDGVARAAEVAGCRRLAADAGAECIVVVTACSDPEVHRSRIEGRTRGIPGWQELEWDAVAASVGRWEAPPQPDLVLDAVAPLEANVAAVRALLRPADPTPGAR
jgi:hypothetical protein